MKNLLIVLLIFVSSCHFDASSTLKITVLNESKDRLENVTVKLTYYKSNGDFDEPKTTDSNGEVTFVLEEWGNGTAWGTTLVPSLTRGGDTLEIVENDKIHVYQKGNEYDGEDYKETIIVK